MLRKECKYRIISMFFFLISAAILLMINTEFIPQKWFLYVELLSLSRYAFIELKIARTIKTIRLYKSDGFQLTVVELVLNKPNPTTHRSSQCCRA